MLELAVTTQIEQRSASEVIRRRIRRPKLGQSPIYLLVSAPQLFESAFAIPEDGNDDEPLSLRSRGSSIPPSTTTRNLSTGLLLLRHTGLVLLRP